MNLIEQTKVARINKKMVAEWMDFGLNVLLIGEKGVGKTQISREVAVEKYGEQNVVYLSASTLDPFLDLIGVPKEEHNAQGETFLEYIRPKRVHNDIRCLIIDELNRAPHRKILDALMELIQFRSINGESFKKLESIIACINPPCKDEDDDAEFNYNVVNLDPAHIDRFDIRIHIPHEPDSTYFVSNFGNDGQTAVDWWMQLKEPQKRTVSPRCLERTIRLFRKGVNLEYVLPTSVNVSDLVKSLTSDDLVKFHRDLMSKPTLAAMKKAVKNLPYWNKYSEMVMENNSMWKFFEAWPEEKVGKLLDGNKDFRNWFVQQHDNPKVSEFLENHAKVHHSKYFDLMNHLKEKFAKEDKKKPVRIQFTDLEGEYYDQEPFTITHTFEAWPDMSSYDAMNSSDKNPGRLENQDNPMVLPQRISTYQNALKFIDADGVAALNKVGVFVDKDGKTSQLNRNQLDWLSSLIIRELEEESKTDSNDDLMEDQMKTVPVLLGFIPDLIEHRSPKEKSIYMKKINDYYLKKFEKVPAYADVIKSLKEASATPVSVEEEINEFLK